MRTLMIAHIKTNLLAGFTLVLLAIPALVYKMHQKQIRFHAQNGHKAIDKKKITYHPVNPLQLFTK